MCVNLRIKTTEYTEKHGVFDTNLVFSSVNSVSSVVKNYKVSVYDAPHCFIKESTNYTNIYELRYKIGSLFVLIRVNSRSFVDKYCLSGAHDAPHCFIIGRKS